MDPIVKLTNALMEGNMEVANKMIESIGIKMAQEDRHLTGK